MGCSGSSAGELPRWYKRIQDHADVPRHPASFLDIRSLKFEEVIVNQGNGNGNGGITYVFLAARKEEDGRSEGVFLAVKRMSKVDIIKDKKVDQVSSALAALDKVRSPFAITLEHFCHDSRHLFFAYTFASRGELFETLRRDGPLDETVAKFCASQMAAAFVHLHSRSIVHRQATPENIFIGDDCYLQLGGFGISKFVEGQTYTFCGVPEYLAPECYGNKGHSHMVDWWILGVLTYEMLVGLPPFVDEEPWGLLHQKILKGKINFPRHLGANVTRFLKGLLTANVSKRQASLSGPVATYFSDVNWHELLTKARPSLLQAPLWKPCIPMSEPESAPAVAAAADPFTMFGGCVERGSASPTPLVGPGSGTPCELRTGAQVAAGELAAESEGEIEENPVLADVSDNPVRV